MAKKRTESLVARDMLLAFRAVRRGSSTLGSYRLADNATLIDQLGNGSIELAFTNLMGFANEYGAGPESDIGAFFKLCGWGLDGGSLEARQLRYAEIYHCHESTALRRSERGIDKLIGLMREGYSFGTPTAIVHAYQSGKQLKVGLSLGIEQESMWRRPTFRIHPDPPFKPEGYEFEAGEQRYMWTRLDLPDVELISGSSDDPKELAVVDIEWGMTLWPRFQLFGHFADPRLTMLLQVNRRGFAQVTVQWIAVDYIGQEGQLLDDGTWWLVGRGTSEDLGRHRPDRLS